MHRCVLNTHHGVLETQRCVAGIRRGVRRRRPVARPAKIDAVARLQLAALSAQLPAQQQPPRGPARGRTVPAFEHAPVAGAGRQGGRARGRAAPGATMAAGASARSRERSSRSCSRGKCADSTSSCAVCRRTRSDENGAPRAVEPCSNARRSASRRGKPADTSKRCIGSAGRYTPARHPSCAAVGKSLPCASAPSPIHYAQ
jgi:hypothetical protein